VVAVAPVVPDTWVALDDQRIDADLPEPRCQHEARLARADDQHLRVPPVVGLSLAPLVEPVVAGEVPRVLHARRPAIADLLLKPA
jgi:hypothetical protein